MKKYILFFFFFLITNFAFGQASFPYYEDFEGSGDKEWTMVNGTQPNKWFVGSATNNGGSRALYISDDGGSSYQYTNNKASTTHAYRDISIPPGTTNAYITFDWKAYGEGSNYDYLQVWLVPDTDTPTAGLLITPGVGRIQLGGNYSGQNSFQYSSNSVNLSSFAGKNMRVVFSWRNDDIYGYNPAAIDNFSVTKYCKPTSSNRSSLYIREFQFVGVLNNPPAKTSTYSTGYEDWTSFTPIAQQPQNTAMNITAKTNGTTGGSWKAWVDWNRDGDFNDTGEEVYKMTTFTTPAVTFGFIIPSTVLGNYRLRIATSSTSKLDGTYDFSPCSVLSEGEFEDYTFNVIADCSAKVVKVNEKLYDGERCGAGSVKLSATGNASAVSFRWYANETGGTPLPNANVSSANFDTPPITPTDPSKSYYATYYVTAVSSDGCETAYRYPVQARIDPNPHVAFSTSDPSICGEDIPSLLVTATGDRYQDVIFENFDSGLGIFKGNVTDSESIFNATKAEWLNKPSNYIPKISEGYQGLSPAMSSGYFGGNFAMINSDINRSTDIKYHLVSNNTTNPNKLIDVRGFLELQLDFDLFHFSIAKDNNQGYVQVSYTLDGSVANPVWVPLYLPGIPDPELPPTTPVDHTKYWDNIGNPFIWQHFTVTIPGTNFNTDKFAIRFTHFSKGRISGVQKFFEGITAVDNVKLSGFKTINTPFKWNSAATTIYDTDCVTPLLINDTRSTVCVKPSPIELENLNWNLHANATFSNGCPADGYYDVNNDTKTWKQPGKTDWKQSDDWKPVGVPDIKKCVIARTPVELPSGTNGLARSVIVKPGGSVSVRTNSNLEVQNHVKNQAAAADFLVESDANLKQNNDASVNEGSITVKRDAKMKRLDYTYWGAPVTGQNLKAFSNGTLDSRFYVYREVDDYFDGVFAFSKSGAYDGSVMSDAFPLQDKNTYNFEITKGYAVRAPNNYTSTNTIFNGTFVGVPNNGGIKNFVLKYTDAAHGNNFVANPYPSNIDFSKLYADNFEYMYNTAWFWTNVNPNPVMQGSNYPSKYLGVDYYNNYAIYNGSGGVGPTSTAPVNGSTSGPTSLIPTNIIKVGQGFVIRAKAAGKDKYLVFKNAIRSIDNSGKFFNARTANANSTSVDRYWLRLSTPLGVNNDILVAYKEGATNDYEIDYDAKMMANPPDAFYSVLNEDKLVIQGRQFPLNTNDAVTLGARFYQPGSYKVSILKKEGVFDNGQEIYLKDKLVGKLVNLQYEDYTFNVSAEGNITDRFEIVYRNNATLSTDNVNKQNVVVYKNEDHYTIESMDKITEIFLFDAAGKLINKFLPNVNKAEVSSQNLSKGVYILKIKTSGKIISKKVIK